jgi:hypothetical protein
MLSQTRGFAVVNIDCVSIRNAGNAKDAVAYADKIA